MGASAVFVDYDGTITDVDTFDVLVRRFAGDGPWKRIEGQLLRGELSLRDALQMEAAFVRGTLDEADARLRADVVFDPNFGRFVAACESRDIPLTIVSSGIEPLIRRALERQGLGHVTLVANPVDIRPSGWHIRFRDDSENGNDKAALVRAARERGAHTVYIGDGRSDYEAALAAHERYAKAGRNLERFLTRERSPFRAFTSFAELMDVPAGLTGYDPSCAILP